MLHILWMLIKWILILGGILLGLVLALLLLLLFCPVRYRGQMCKKGNSFRESEIWLQGSWLFGGVSFQAEKKEDGISKEFRLFGIPVLSLMERHRKRKTEAAEKRNRNETFESVCPQKSPVLEASGTEREPVSGESSVPEAEREEISPEKTNKIAELREKLNSVWSRLKDIPAMCRKISLTIRNICDKIEWWKSFFEDPGTKAGITFAKVRAWKLLKHVFPKRISGQIRFASEDPSVTGAVLAVLGMTMPLHQNRIEILPIFENRNFLEGDVKMKGRIYGVVPAKILLEIYFNKDIKYMFRKWKHKEV